MDLRVDVDGLYQTESAEDGHRPATEGFCSEHDGLMHAYGHDASTAIRIGRSKRSAMASSTGR